MALLKQYNGNVLSFWCPGCRSEHSFPLTGEVKWQWDGSMQAPTITPSLLRHEGGPSRPRCHTVITKGRIQFCPDSTHSLAGHNVPMVDWDTLLKKGTSMQTEPENQAQEQPNQAQAPAVGDPHPAFDEAVAYMEKRGYSHGAAVEIVNREGIETILSGKKADETEAAGEQAAAATAASASAPSNEAAKQEEEAPAPMKTCPSCGTKYPMGYDRCPHDNALLA